MIAIQQSIAEFSVRLVGLVDKDNSDSDSSELSGEVEEYPAELIDFMNFEDSYMRKIDNNYGWSDSDDKSDVQADNDIRNAKTPEKISLVGWEDESDYSWSSAESYREILNGKGIQNAMVESIAGAIADEMDDWLNEADEEEWDVNADSRDASSGSDVDLL